MHLIITRVFGHIVIQAYVDYDKVATPKPYLNVIKTKQIYFVKDISTKFDKPYHFCTNVV